MKKLIALLLAALLIIGMTACSTKQTPAEETKTEPAAAESASTAEKSAQQPTEEAPVAITWGLYETDNLTAELWDSVIAAFEADNPGIKVEKIVATGDDRTMFWKTLAASGSFPDIVMEANYIASSAPEMFAEVPADTLSLFEEGALCTYGGKNITIPYSKQLRMQVYYNIADYNELGLSEPETYDAFVENCAALKAAGKTPLLCGGTGDVWATGQPWWISVTNQQIVASDPDFVAKINSGEKTWLDPVVLDSMSTWKELIDAGYYHPGCMSWSYAQAAAEFQNGGATMMIDGSWAAAGFDSAGDDRFGVFVLPIPGGLEGYCCPISYWGVSATSEQPEAAWSFINWFFSTPEAYSSVLKADGLNSVTKNAVTYELGPVATKMVQNLDGMTLYPEIQSLSGDEIIDAQIVNETCKAMQLIFTGTDVTEAMQTVQDLQDMINMSNN